jgi:hypothetical protein
VTNQWGTSATSSADQYTYVQGLAELPEIGRCVSKPGSGAFKGLKPVCVVKSPTHTGNFEWLPGPGPKGTFKERLSSPALETVNGKRISCSFMFVIGEITGAKTLKVSEVALQGCLLVGPNLTCFSEPSDPGTIESHTALVGELGFIPGSSNPSNPYVGWDLKPESELNPTMLEFFCGERKSAPAYRVSLEGSVIARVRPTNKMLSSGVFTVLYRQEKGIQKPTAFIGGVEDVLTQITTPTLNPTEPKTEQVGLATGGEMIMEEPMEIKAKQR